MASRPNLDEIRQQIEAGKKAEARRALSSILMRDSKNAEAWWLYAQVAEDKKQLYGILTALADDKLPSNPYLPRARAMLAKMPYQPVTSKSAIPAGGGVSLSKLLIAVMAIIVVLIVAVVGNEISTRISAAAASSIQPPASQANDQGIKVVVVTIPPVLTTPTPLPTLTLFPSSTPRPTSTPRAVSPTPTATSQPELADVLPTLHDSLSAKVGSLFDIAAKVTSTLGDADSFSSQTAQTTLDWIAQIQVLRNKVVTTNLSAVPINISQQVVIPAQSAYMDYANGLLYWIDLQVEANRLYKSLATTSSDTLPTAQKAWADQKALAAKQADVVASKRNALMKALTNYDIETTQVVLAARASSNALTFASNGPASLRLKAGGYTVYYFVQPTENTDANKVSLWLTQGENSASKQNLVNGSKQKLSDSVTVTLQDGTYQVKADSASWWVLVFDPAS